MKKRYVVGILGLSMLCGGLLFGCVGEGSTELSAPENLSFDGIELTWDEVEGAAGYLVDVDGTQYETQTPSLDLFEETIEFKTYTMQVMAYAEGYGQLDSAWSQPLQYEVEFKDNSLGGSLTDDGTGWEVYGNSEVLSGKVVIPEEFDGIPITSVAIRGFESCSEITSLVLPDSITKLGQRAFRGCTSLRRVRFSQELTGVPAYSFQNCTSLQEVDLPYSLRTISAYAFQGCGFFSFEVPHGIWSFSMSAVDSCTSLREITLPETVRELEGGVSGCPQLERLTVDEANPVYYGEGNCIIRREGGVLALGCKTSVIPQGVTTIGEKAFKGIEGLTQITIPEWVTSIGYEAFSGACDLQSVIFSSTVSLIESGVFSDTALTEVTLPAGVAIGSLVFSGSELKRVVLSEGTTELAAYCFAGTEKLTEVVLPQSLRTIAEYAFAGSGISEINFPASVENITPKAFYNTPLKSITVDEANEVYYSAGNCILRREDNALILGGGGGLIPQEAVTIEEYAFYGRRGLETVSIPQGITAIGDYAFAECGELTEVSGACSGTIGAYAFSECGSLKSVEVPRGVTSIGAYAFSECGSLKSVIVPRGVTSIGAYAFLRCIRLSRVSLPDGLLSIAEYAFHDTWSLGSLTVPESVTTVGKGAFCVCTLYVSWENDDSVPSGWARYEFEQSGPVLAVMGEINIAYGCEIAYDEFGYPYVCSFEWVREARYMNSFRGTYRASKPSEFLEEGMNVPERHGYLFSGWATQEGGEVVYGTYSFEVLPPEEIGDSNFGLPVTPRWNRTGSTVIEVLDDMESLQLYAVWVPNEE